MKKLIMFVFAFMLAGSVAFAQGNHSASVEQTGSQNETIVDQDAHFGTGHTAEVTQQAGDLNYANLDQNQANSEAYIIQTGTENESRTNQAGYNVMDVLQEGDHNILGRYGNLNSAAYQKNGGGNLATDMNNLDLDQLGNNNEAGVWQEHHGDASILQSGHDNEAGVSQSGAAFGALNEATIAQHGAYNEADAYQRGEGNVASMLQGIDAYYSNENVASVRQSGDDNEAYFSLQWGDLTEVAITHTGNSNYSEFTVKYGNENAFSEEAEGSFNRTKFIVAPDWGSLNKVAIQKSGDNNTVAGNISGDRNEVDVIQEGNDNNVGTAWNAGDGVNITGGDNIVDISQMSNSNSSINTVYGHSNSVTVMQN